MTYVKRVGSAALISLLSAYSYADIPFFDQNPDTPFAPSYKGATAVDKQVLALCGGWGAPVSKQSIRDFLAQQTDILERVNSTSAQPPMSFATWLRIWTEKDAFAHVFCGEPYVKRGKNKLGGLHFAPRYMEAQRKGWAYMCQRQQQCFNTDNEWLPGKGIYSIPVRFKGIHGGTGKKPVSGYHREMSARHILYQATLAYAVYSPHLSTRTRSCILSVHGEGAYPDHQAVAAMNARALVTFYAVGPIGRQNSIDNYQSARTCRTPAY